MVSYLSNFMMIFSPLIYKILSTFKSFRSISISLKKILLLYYITPYINYYMKFKAIVVEENKEFILRSEIGEKIKDL